jgi:hypothetical protein
VPLSLRITRDMDGALRQRAEAEQVSPSALARRLLRQGLQDAPAAVLTEERVEQIARRVLRETA